MVAIAFAAAFGFLGGVLILQVVARRPLGAPALGNALVYLVAVSALAILNFEAEILDQKGAATFAFDEVDAGYTTFTVQRLINLIPFYLTEAWWAAIGMNVAAMAVVKAYLYDRAPGLSRIMWAPAILNFAMFSLRDPLIGVSLFVLTLVLCLPRPRHWVVGSATLVATYSLRPENLAIFLGAWLIGLRKRLSRHPWLVAAVPVILVGAFYLFTVLPELLGVSTVGMSADDIPATLHEFFVVRAERNSGEGDGGGSNILGGQLTSLPVFIRFPIQVLCFFVLPLPFEVRNLAMAMALVDSAVFIAVAVAFWRRSPAPAKHLFVCYVIGVSFFASNYGNLLRLRLPAYFIMAAGLLVAHLATQRAAEAERMEEPDAEGSPFRGPSRGRRT